MKFESADTKVLFVQSYDRTVLLRFGNKVSRKAESKCHELGIFVIDLDKTLLKLNLGKEHLLLSGLTRLKF